MSINFSVNDTVVVKQGYVKNTLAALNSAQIVPGSLEILEKLGKGVLTVTATGSILSQGRTGAQRRYYLTLLPSSSHTLYNAGAGVSVYFLQEAQLNNAFQDVSDTSPLTTNGIPVIHESVALTGGSAANGADQRKLWYGSSDITECHCAADGYLHMANFLVYPSATFPVDSTIDVKIEIDGELAHTISIVGDTQLTVHQKIKIFTPDEIPVSAGSVVIVKQDVTNRVSGTYWMTLNLTFAYYI